MRGPGNDRQVWLSRNYSLHGLAIQLAICLRARAANSRALGAVQQPELNSSPVNHSAHQTIQRIDLPHQMAFAKPADGWIARHFANCFSAVSEKRGACAEAGSRCSSFGAGMAATNDNDIKMGVHARFSTPSASTGQNTSAFHVKHGHFPMQKRLKIAPSHSSTPTLPVSLPTSSDARRISSALSSRACGDTVSASLSNRIEL